MEKQPSEDQKQQQESFLKEQAKYWKSFVHDLFLGTIKRMVVSPLVFGLTFMVGAYVFYKFSIQTQEVFVILKILEAVVVFPLYGLVGILAGLLYGANATMLKKVNELERGVHLIVEPLMSMIIEKLPGGQQGIEIEEFNALLDAQIRGFTKTSRAQFRLFSLVGLFFRLFLRMTLRFLRYLLLHDLLEHLQEKGEMQISAKLVERYHREKLVANTVDLVKTRLELIQYGIYGVLVVFLAVPIVLMLVF